MRILNINRIEISQRGQVRIAISPNHVKSAIELHNIWRDGKTPTGPENLSLPVVLSHRLTTLCRGSELSHLPDPRMTSPRRRALSSQSCHRCAKSRLRRTLRRDGRDGRGRAPEPSPIVLKLEIKAAVLRAKTILRGMPRMWRGRIGAEASKFLHIALL